MIKLRKSFKNKKMDTWVSGKMRYGTYSMSTIDMPEREKEGEENIQGITEDHGFPNELKQTISAYNGWKYTHT